MARTVHKHSTVFLCVLRINVSRARARDLALRAILMDTHVGLPFEGTQMSQTENELLSSSKVDKLVVLVEEATRATTDASSRFIEPARGTLDRAKSRRHHLIFGRRGSG